MVRASNRAKKSKKQAEDDVDYAAAADSFADADDGGLLVENDDHPDDNENDNSRGSVGGDNDDNDDEEEEDDHDAGSDGGRSSDEDGDGPDGDSVREGEESEGSEEVSGSSDESRDGDNLDGDDDEDDEDAQGQPVVPSKAVRSASSSHPEACTFDLRNLLATNTHQVDTVALYKQPAKKDKVPSDEGKAITIPGDSMPAVANDDALLRMATDGCQQLIAALWQLPVERSDAGPLVTLPGYEEVRIPRALVRWPKEYAPGG
jgi:Ribosome biogenesis regulatory protein (RRS1)